MGKLFLKCALTSIFILVIFLFSAPKIYAYNSDAFVTTWKTDNQGITNSNQIRLPIQTAYGSTNYTVEWGDGTSDTNVDGSITHTYATPGTYTVAITGDLKGFFSGVYDNTDSKKLITIEQWGTIQWASFDYAFTLSRNLVAVNATDTPNMSNITNIAGMFLACNSLTKINNISNWDVSNVQNFEGAFAETQFNQDLSNWHITSAVTMQSMLRQTPFSTVNYDNLLIAWAKQPLNQNVILGVDNTTYFCGESSRNYLITNYNWNIVDAGKNRTTLDCVPTLHYRGGFIEDFIKNDGSVIGNIVIQIGKDTFVNSSGNLILGKHYKIENLPAKLTPTLSISTDGTTATLSLSGNATKHSSSNSINNLRITFFDGAFTNTEHASNMVNYYFYAGTISFVNQGSTILFGSDGAGGNQTPQIYIINPDNGNILWSKTISYDINGMDVNPLDNNLYGVTSNGDTAGNNPYSLFKIDPISGESTLLGQIKDSQNHSFGFPDIAFRSNGLLYARAGWYNDAYSLYTIDITCPDNICTATKVGETSIGSGGGGGIAFDSKDNLYIFDTENTGYFRVNPNDGSIIDSFTYKNVTGNDYPILASKFDKNNNLYLIRSYWGRNPVELISLDLTTYELKNALEFAPKKQFMTALAFVKVLKPDPLVPTEGPVTGKIEKQTQYASSETNQTPSETPTDNNNENLPPYVMSVVDSQGNKLVAITLYIDGKEYLTDQFGNIYSELPLTGESNIQINIKGNMIKGMVVGDRIIAQIVEVTNNKNAKKANNVPIFVFIVLTLLTGLVFIYLRNIKRNK